MRGIKLNLFYYSDLFSIFKIAQFNLQNHEFLIVIDNIMNQIIVNNNICRSIWKDSKF